MSRSERASPRGSMPYDCELGAEVRAVFDADVGPIVAGLVWFSVIGLLNN